MKQVFKTPDRGFVIEEVPAPLCFNGGVLVRTHYSAISAGTELATARTLSEKESSLCRFFPDIELYQKALRKIISEGISETFEAREKYRTTLLAKGYSLAGEVVEVGGGIDDLKRGDFVACGGSGFASHAEYVAVPRNLVAKVPEGLDLSLAAFATIGSIAIHAVRQSESGLGDRVVVIGLGIIGLLAVQLLKISGCRVMGIDINKKRVLAAQQIGADDAICLENGMDVIDKVLDFSNGIGVDAALICAATKSSDPVHQGMSMLRKRGRIVIVGDVGLTFNRSPFYEKEAEVRISCSYGPGRYDPKYEIGGNDYPIGYVRWTLNRNMSEFMNLANEGKIQIEPFISHRVSIDEAPEAYKALEDKTKRSLGALISYGRDKTISPIKRKIQVYQKKSIKGLIRIGIIGAGGFAQRQHIPNLLKAKIQTSLVAVCTRNSANAKQVGKIFRAQYCTTDYQDIISDAQIDAVIIATRHDSHARIAIDALKAGKHVLMEKPMAIKRIELEELKTVAQGADVVFSVGFNRRYSALIGKVAKHLTRLKKPIQMLYRVNAGFIPPEHWTQKRDVGGGRIVGEACHFLDVMQFLTREEVVKITAEPAISLDRDVDTYDSYVASLKYEDGSLGTLVYSSVGNKSEGKEYLEIHADQTSFILEDYQKLKVRGKASENIGLKKLDKGWAGEMDAFLRSIRGEKSNLISLDEAVNITNMCFDIDEIVRHSS